jgi:hypothetical protein
MDNLHNGFGQVLFRSIRKALRGDLEAWGTLKRTGNVKEQYL